MEASPPLSPTNISGFKGSNLMSTYPTAGSNGEEHQNDTQLSKSSLRIAGKPFLTAYGQGVENQDMGQGLSWKGAPYEDKTVDDLQYVRDIIANVSTIYSVDTSRLYACGESNGGGFVALLASHPDAPPVFAALAPVCPALYKETYVSGESRPWKAIPMLHVHGLKDTVTPFYGRAEGVGWGALPDVRLWRRQWAERNGCGSGGYPGGLVQPTQVNEVHPGVWEEVWNCGLDGNSAEVRALSVEGLGHSWPTLQGTGELEQPTEGLSFEFTEQQLMQFFSRHSLKA